MVDAEKKKRRPTHFAGSKEHGLKQKKQNLFTLIKVSTACHM